MSQEQIDDFAFNEDEIDFDIDLSDDKRKDDKRKDIVSDKSGTFSSGSESSLEPPAPVEDYIVSP